MVSSARECQACYTSGTPAFLGLLQSGGIVFQWKQLRTQKKTVSLDVLVAGTDSSCLAISAISGSWVLVRFGFGSVPISSVNANSHTTSDNCAESGLPNSPVLNPENDWWTAQMLSLSVLYWSVVILNDKTLTKDSVNLQLFNNLISAALNLPQWLKVIS